jgi:hypothetical protein
VSTLPPWAQPGITDVPVARAFLAALRAEDTLFLGSNDADGAPALTSQTQRLRGHGITVAANVVTATPPPADLVALHRSFGLGPGRSFCPRDPSERTRLADLVLADGALVERIRAAPGLTKILISYKSAAAARLGETLGLKQVLCSPRPEAYEAANDKLALAEAGARHGFATLETVAVGDEKALAAAFPVLATRWGAGCIVRLRRGASGRNIHHARTLRGARRAWRKLAAIDPVPIVMPYLPPGRVRRNVAAHGIVTADGFAPLLFTDQIVKGHYFHGGSTTEPWRPEDVAAIRAALDGVARWFRAIGYVDAPAGIDGFLVDDHDGPRFVVLDPNARLSATMQPWAATAMLAERAGEPLVWRFEGMRLIGAALSVDVLRRRLDVDFLGPDRVARGGVLPTTLSQRRLGPLADNHLWALLVGRDADRVAGLRRRLRGVALIAR